MPTTKICDRCGRQKPATETYFGLNLRYRDHLQPYCRACGHHVAAERRKRKTERAREWARANPAKVRESSRRTHEKNRSQRLAYMRRWRKENKERIAEYQRQYAQRRHTSE